jgi:threonyl-tRNA synthetase
VLSVFVKLFPTCLQYNKFKLRILNEKVNTPTTTVYRCGPLIDLCRGPHVRHTGKVKSFKVTKVSNIYPSLSYTLGHATCYSLITEKPC